MPPLKVLEKVEEADILGGGGGESEGVPLEEDAIVGVGGGEAEVVGVVEGVSQK